MRFGVHLFQLTDLVPPNSSRSQVTARILKYSPAKTVRSFHDAGFNIAEISTDLSVFLPNSLNKKSISKLLKLKNQKGMNYTAHLPLWSIELASPHESVRRASVEATTLAIESVKPLDPECYVVHATGALAAEFFHKNVHPLAKDYTIKMFKENAVQSLKEILEITNLPSRKIAAETISFPLKETLEIVDELDLSICFDVGHVLAGFSGPVDFFEALEQCLPRLGEIHLHDSPKMGDNGEPMHEQDHIPIGKGDLDSKRFFDMLLAAQFDGPIIFELTLDESLESINSLRSQRIIVK